MDIIRTTARWLDEIPYSLIALFLRIVAAHPFFVSGQTKIEGPTVGGEVFGPILCGKNRSSHILQDHSILPPR
jgi:hypothetical protein